MGRTTDCVRGILHAFRERREAQRHALVGPPELWRQKRQFQIDFLRRHGLQPKHRLLDIGCGTLRGGIPVIAFLDAGRYTGVDVRSEVIDEARKELRVHGLDDKQPTLLAGSVADIDAAARFDVAWAFSVLFHMDEAALDVALGAVASRLDSDGVFYANVILGTDVPGEWRGFPVAPRSIEWYRARCAGRGLHVAELGELATLGHVTGDPTQDSQQMLEIRPERIG